MAVLQADMHDSASHQTTEYNQRAPWVAGLVVYALATVAAIIATTAVIRAREGYEVPSGGFGYGLGWFIAVLAAVPLVFARSWVQSEAWIPGGLRYSTFHSSDPHRANAATRALRLTVVAGLMSATAAMLLVDGSIKSLGVAACVSILVCSFGPTISAMRRLYGWLYVLLAGLLLAGLGVLAEFDTALRGMTRSGNEPIGFSGLSPLLRPWQAPDRIELALQNWSEYVADFPAAFSMESTRSPFPLEAARWHALIDSLVVAPAYALLLVGLTSWLIQGLPHTLKGGRLKAILSVSRFAAPVVAMVDIAENFAGLAAVRVAQYASPARFTDDGERVIEFAMFSDHLAMLRGFASSLKWIMLVGIGAACVIALVHWLRTNGAAQRETIRPLRAHIALVVLVFLLLRNSQATDAIRAWQTDVTSSNLDGPPLVWTLAFAVLAGLAIRYLADFTLQQAHLAKLPGNRWPAERPPRVGYGLLSLAVALVLAIFLEARGLLVPVGIFFVLEAMSWPLQPRNGHHHGVRARMHEARSWWGDRAFRQLTIASIALVAASTLAHGIWQRGGVRWVLIVGAWCAVGQSVWQLRRALRHRGNGPAPDADSGPAHPAAGEPAPIPGKTVSRQGSPAGSARGATSGRTGSFRTATSYVSTTVSTTLSRVPTPTASYGLPALLGTLVLVFLGAAVIRSAAGLVIYRSGGVGMVVLGLLAIALGAILLTLPRHRFTFWRSDLGLAAVRLGVVSLFGLYLLVWEVVSVDALIRRAQEIGSIGLVFAFIAVAAVLASTISYLTEQTTAVDSLKLIGFKRVPFYLLIGLWVVTNAIIDSGGYHNAETTEFAANAQIDGSPVTAVSPNATAKATFDHWFDQCRGEVAANPDGPARTVPMVFVAATGGGIRAAYWSSSVLEQFTTQVAPKSPCSQPIYAMSGASGGSVGLATHVAATLNNASPPSSQLLGDNFLAPSVGWLLFVDSFRPFFLWDIDGTGTADRAAVLARAFELAWPGEGNTPPLPDATRPGCANWVPEPGPVTVSTGLKSVWCRGAPLLLMNATEVNSGCRFLVSVLDNRTAPGRESSNSVNCRRPPGAFDSDPSRAASDRIGPLGATIDGVDYLCDDQDVALSVGAVLSARFPLVSPSGRVEQCADNVEHPEVAYVVDGGYLDNSGAASLVELWSEVSRYVDDENSDDSTPCIVPIFLQIDNGYDFADPSAASRPIEVIVPFSAAASSLSSREAEAKQVAANIFGSSAIPGDLTVRLGDFTLPSRWVRIVPEAHPGLQAPLGWVLSGAAQADLDAQLALEAQTGFGQLERLFDDRVWCAEFRPEAEVADSAPADPVMGDDG